METVAELLKRCRKRPDEFPIQVAKVLQAVVADERLFRGAERSDDATKANRLLKRREVALVIGHDALVLKLACAQPAQRETKPRIVAPALRVLVVLLVLAHVDLRVCRFDLLVHETARKCVGRLENHVPRFGSTVSVHFAKLPVHQAGGLLEGIRQELSRCRVDIVHPDTRARALRLLGCVLVPSLHLTREKVTLCVGHVIVEVGDALAESPIEVKVACIEKLDRANLEQVADVASVPVVARAREHPKVERAGSQLRVGG
mmetsp:Transcript_12725/g.35923  ORF Transcript_12725/g.35923 Transcript_12725/m.35923 type:complete len:260 (+) Transcript_12725:817-1596(+)